MIFINLSAYADAAVNGSATTPVRAIHQNANYAFTMHIPGNARNEMLISLDPSHFTQWTLFVFICGGIAGFLLRNRLKRGAR